MLEKTDLKRCKQYAYELIDKVKPIVIKKNYNREKVHPFILEAFNTIDLTQKNKLIKILEKYNATIIERQIVQEFLNSYFGIEPINIWENQGAYILSKYACKSVIDDMKEYQEFGNWIRYPFTLDFLDQTIKWINRKDFCKYLMGIYVHKDETLQILHIKAIHDGKEEKQRRYMEYFKQADRKYLMNRDELKVFNKLDNVVTVYRGLSNFNKDYIKGISWTISKDIAENRFANIGAGKGLVYKAKINKEDIFAYCNTRNEQEVIVNYEKLQGIELCEV